MVRSSAAVLIYCFLIFSALFEATNWAFSFQAAIAQDTSFGGLVIRFAVIFAFVTAVFLPMVIYPFALVSRFAHQSEPKVRLLSLLKQTPRAHFGCFCSLIHSLMTMLALVFPICLGAAVSIALIKHGKITDPYCAIVATATMALSAMLRHQLLARFIAPFVVIIENEGVIAGVQTSIDLAKKNGLSIFGGLISLVALAALLWSLSPLTVSALVPFIDGTYVGHLGEITATQVLNLLPFVLFGVTAFAGINELLARLISERELDLLEATIEADLSTVSMEKLVKSGYFAFAMK